MRILSPPPLPVGIVGDGGDISTKMPLSMLLSISQNQLCFKVFLVRLAGFEPTKEALETPVLPLDYRRITSILAQGRYTRLYSVARTNF